jgi:glycosyltransferase involved in cell wall biosynthesis
MASRPLRIAVWHNLPSGGGKRALHDHVRGLVARGHHVEVWCPPQADRAYLPLADVAQEHVVDLDITPPRPVRALHRAGIASRRKRTLARVDAHCAAVARAIGDDFDVVLSGGCQFVAVPPLALHARLPAAIYLGEPNRPLYEALPALPWLAGGYTAREAVVAGRAELASLGAFERVLVNSRFSREAVLRAFGIEAQVCYLGVDTDHFHPTDHPTRDYLIGLGSVSRAKGIETVLEAVARVAERPPLVWVANIVESDAYLAHVESRAQSLGVDLSIKRNIDEGELVALLQNARALVYAPRLEPFGYAPLEANACGTGVVGVAEGGVRESVVDGENGILVEGDQLAAAIARVWNDRTEADALGARGRTHVVDHWSDDEAVSRIEAALVAVATTSARSAR